MPKQIHHFGCVGDNRLSVSPGNRSCEKTGDFDVFFQRKQMWYLYRVRLDEIRPVVDIGFFVEKGFEFWKLHHFAIRPSTMVSFRSAISASSSLWVTMTNVWPNSSRSLKNNLCRFSAECVSRFPD